MYAIIVRSVDNLEMIKGGRRLESTSLRGKKQPSERKDTSDDLRCAKGFITTADFLREPNQLQDSQFRRELLGRDLIGRLL